MNLIPWKGKRSASNLSERPAADVRTEIENLFDRWLHDPWGPEWPSLLSHSSGLLPRLDMAETDNNVTIRVELPGVSAKDVNIEVAGNMLTLSGEKSAQQEREAGEYRCCERQFGSFQRTIQLPVSVDASKVEATCKDGVLSITLPKRSEARARRITVRNA